MTFITPRRACYIRMVQASPRRKQLAKRPPVKPKRILKWQRDPEGMRLRILEAAKQEFSTHGIGGARVDRIAANAGANKRMLYYHVGNKEDLYLAVLEGAYEKIRGEERGLDLEHLDPPEAIERLIEFTWNYFIRNPEFLALLNTENLAKAKNLKRSTKVKSMHSPFVEMIRDVVQRGVASGDFRVAVDPVQLYISIAALGFFYLSNSATLSVIFGRDLLKKEARDERLAHMVSLVLAALTGKVDGAVRPAQGAEAARAGTSYRLISPLGLRAGVGTMASIANSTRRPRPAWPLDPPKSAFGRRRLAEPRQISSGIRKSCQAPKSKIFPCHFGKSEL